MTEKKHIPTFFPSVPNPLPYSLPVAPEKQLQGYQMNFDTSSENHAVPYSYWDSSETCDLLLEVDENSEEY